MKPGSAGPGVPGIYPVIYDEKGNVVEAGSGRAGNICIRNPWPGIFQTVWGKPERFVQIYYEKYCRNKERKTGVTGRTSLVTVLFWQPTAISGSLAGSTM